MDETRTDPAAEASAQPQAESGADATAEVTPSVEEPESVEQLVDELEAVAEAAQRSTSEGDTEFSADLDPDTLAFGAPKPLALVCQWCNQPLESAELEACPHCGSRLRPTDDNLIVPGVTTLSSEAARALELVEIQRNREAAKSGAAMYTQTSLSTSTPVVPAPDEATIEAANRPPDDEVRRLMLEMELEARQAREVADTRLDIESMMAADAAQRIEAEDAQSAESAVSGDAGASGDDESAASGDVAPAASGDVAPASDGDAGGDADEASSTA